MLQPLGISAEAEAVYVALGPLSSASVDDLAKLTGTTPDEVRDTLEELRRLGLATESSTSWRPLPLLDVVNHLKVQRLSEIEMASVAAEALNSHLLAAGETPGRRDQDPRRPGVHRRRAPRAAAIRRSGRSVPSTRRRTSRHGRM